MTGFMGGFTLSRWLPREAWWLLYINRADHATALESTNGSPADHYDRDLSPGYRAGIEAAFEQLFEHAGPVTRIDATFYRDLHDLAISRLTGATDDELVEEWSTGDLEEMVSRDGKSAGSVRFPMAHPKGSRAIAADLKLEQFLLDGQVVRVLTEPDFDHDLDGAMRMRDSMRGDQPVLYACLYGVEAGMISVNYRRAMAPRLVDAVGARFDEDLRHAGSRRDRLAAITKLIRTLHVLHLFTNANGRLNITLLLTKLLLDQGLSPVVLANQDDLFSGSYTVDEMVDEIERELEAYRQIVDDELARQQRDRSRDRSSENCAVQ